MTAFVTFTWPAAAATTEYSDSQDLKHKDLVNFDAPAFEATTAFLHVYKTSDTDPDTADGDCTFKPCYDEAGAPIGFIVDTSGRWVLWNPGARLNLRRIRLRAMTAPSGTAVNQDGQQLVGYLRDMA
jgi:hypothetical protein